MQAVEAAAKPVRTPTSLWCTRVSDQSYVMLGKPDSEGWAKFQCLSNLERIREWRVGDMRPMNEAARAILASLES